jgi:hypothetical protein
MNIITEAISAFVNKTSLPPANELVTSLLEAEKNCKQNKLTYDFSQIIGKWQLCFITGTKKSQKRAGIILGSGRYISRLFKIYITLKPDQTIDNTVLFGNINLTVSGLTKFLDKKNILAFDFTRIEVKIFGLTLYKGAMRGGKESEAKFYQDSIKKQAFFAYFLVDNDFLAARGRGGGLALWVREKESN